MLYEANDEIRKELEWAASRRLARLREREPFDYLDWVINELEEFHVRGWKRVPKHFVPSLLAVQEIQTDGLRVPERWPGLIRDAIDRCFNIQEQLLQLRDPERARNASPWADPGEAVPQAVGEQAFAAI